MSGIVRSSAMDVRSGRREVTVWQPLLLRCWWGNARSCHAPLVAIVRQTLMIVKR